MAPKPSEPRLDRLGRVPAWLILIIPPLCWAGNFVIGRAMHAEIPPGAFTFWRWVVAAAVLVPFAAADAWRHRRVLVRLQYFVYRGLQTTTAINGVLIMSTIPVAIPVVALLLDGTLIGRRQALASPYR
jgi:drug/metabolite transporter (DMT)-like permease